MKFMVDAHLPRRLVSRLQQAGFDAKHTLDLPRGNRTKDPEIDEISIKELKSGGDKRYRFRRFDHLERATLETFIGLNRKHKE